MAVNRYELRRDMVLKEANAAGTAWLRASLLPERSAHPRGSCFGVMSRRGWSIRK